MPDEPGGVVGDPSRARDGWDQNFSRPPRGFDSPRRPDTAAAEEDPHAYVGGSRYVSALRAFVQVTRLSIDGMVGESLLLRSCVLSVRRVS